MDVLLDTLKQFGVTWPKFLAQVLLFLIVYLILKKYAFGPVMEVLESRRQRIAEGEENLKRIKSDLEAAEEKAPNRPMHEFLRDEFLTSIEP